MDSMNFMQDELIEAENHLDSISSYKLRSVYLVSSASSLEEALSLNEARIPRIDSLLDDSLVKSYISVHPFYPSARSEA